MSILRGARVLLGITGGVAAHKAVDLASKLVQQGARVDVVLTESARQFVGPAGLQAITRRPVHGSAFEPWTESYAGHITLGEESDLIIVAPATANVIAELAMGLAPDMLGAAALASNAPLLIAPAMEDTMYRHPATQHNLETLQQRGAILVGPESGRLASGDYGVGRMSEPTTILGAARFALGQHGLLSGKRIVVTAGGTREALDPVRYLGNRSTGLMGYAVAQAAIDAGAEVTLVSGPTSLPTPYGAVRIDVQTAVQMKHAIGEAVKGAQAIVMSAAVADYRPKDVRSEKMKKSELGASLALDLVANPDIIAEIDEPGLLKIGFAAETSNLVGHARKKLTQKGLDLVVANDAEQAIGSRDNRVTLVWPDGRVDELPLMPKDDVAVMLVDRIAELLAR
ncbi:MAG TPA: bifunctional phosphopantothenoylcysteine decarboxylase/phosphopantothenate--cysteine ligase CoaBC [Thermomicrobiales bacterium]|nr:bifunctional phosphopantothenoylcysteine decarboxylase/phosphopantothenate--cysteine ligase CoaBC [Thermomicrobiales bacterium]